MKTLLSTSLMSLGLAAKSPLISDRALYDFIFDKRTPDQGWLECQTCQATVSLVDSYLTDEKFIAPYMEDIVQWCSTFMQPESCSGFVKLHHVIIDNLVRFNLKPEYFCEKISKTCDTNYYIEDKHEDFRDRVLKDKPEHIQDDEFIQKLYDGMKGQKDRKTFKALHLADLHVDLSYKPGANWNCDTVICCRTSSGPVTKPEYAASEWGEYSCDLPWKTLDLMGQYITREINPDIVFYTGDIVPHDQWSLTLSEVEEHQGHLAAFLMEYFHDVPVFPIEGNHDFEVVNSQDFRTPDKVIQFDIDHW